jgi:hypothetical protein
MPKQQKGSPSSTRYKWIAKSGDVVLSDELHFTCPRGFASATRVAINKAEFIAFALSLDWDSENLVIILKPYV